MTEHPAVEAQRPLWQAEALRLTAFPAPEAPSNLGHNWWMDVIGEAPETTLTDRKKGQRRDKATFLGGELVLSVEPTRIDWRLQTDEGIEVPGYSTIGDFEQILLDFASIGLRWLALPTCPPIQRLAFGAVLIKQAEDRVSAYRELSRFVNFEFDPETVSDLFFQINRPRISVAMENAAEGGRIKVNRLTKWTIAVQFQTEAHASLPRRTITSKIVSQDYACRLDLDMNTSLETQTTLLPEHIPDLFEELVTLGKEIAEQGDIP